MANNTTMIMMMMMLLIAGGAGIYFFMKRKGTTELPIDPATIAAGGGGGGGMGGYSPGSAGSGMFSETNYYYDSPDFEDIDFDRDFDKFERGQWWGRYDKWRLISIGFTEDDIDDFEDWLKKKRRSEGDIKDWLEDRLEDIRDRRNGGSRWRFPWED